MKMYVLSLKRIGQKENHQVISMALIYGLLWLAAAEVLLWHVKLQSFRVKDALLLVFSIGLLIYADHHILRAIDEFVPRGTYWHQVLVFVEIGLISLSAVALLSLKIRKK